MKVQGFLSLRRRSAMLRYGLFICLLSLMAPVWAQQPEELVQQTTDRLLARLGEDMPRMREDDAWRREIVEQELVPVLDLKAITRAVMGDSFAHASKEQRYRFLEVFKASLIDTYARGLAAYDGQEIAVLPGDNSDGRASVSMQIHTATNVIQVDYSLYLNGDNQWRLINLVVNGVNLGKTYRNQFAQLMDIHGGNIDLAIDNWSLQKVEAEAGQG